MNKLRKIEKKREGWRYEYLLSPFYESLLGPNGYNLVLETKELYLESVNLQNIYQEYRHDTETKFCGIDRIWTDNRNFECLTVRQLVKTFVETKRQVKSFSKMSGSNAGYEF